MDRRFGSVDSQLSAIEMRIGVFCARLVPVNALKAGIIDRLVCEPFELGPRVQMIVGEDLGHQDPDEFFLRIDPIVSVKDSTPRIRTDRCTIRAGSSIGDNSKTKSEAVAMASERDLHVADLVLRHECDGLWFEDSRSIEYTTV